jgi:hypothetical protein
MIEVGAMKVSLLQVGRKLETRLESPSSGVPKGKPALD